MPPQMLTFFVIVPVLIAVFLYVFFTLKIARVIAIAVQAAFMVPAAWLLFATQESEIAVTVGDYEGFLGIILRADLLAAVFVCLTVFIFLVVGIYTVQTPYDRTKRLYLFLIFLLEGALIGLFLTRDFFNIFVLVEVSTVVVTILLMYDRERRNLFAGMTFLMVNIIVMQLYLFGLGYIYMLTGVMDMEAASAVLYTMDDRSLALPYALIMTSIASKCSLLPMLTWLPKVNSLTGSRFTIAAIMSGLHIKAGVYLFIRFQDVFGGMGTDFFLVIGIITAVAGVIMALSQTDVRLLLAYSTIAQVGLIITGLSLGDGYSRVGSLFHIVNHSLFKVALFLCASQITYLYHTKDIRKIRGALRQTPLIAAANIMAILGIIGAPLFNGSISKYFLMSGATGATEWIIILINLGTILAFVKYAAIFFGKPLGKVRTEGGDEPDFNRRAVVLGLGIICLALGIGGAQAMDFLFDAPVSLSFWSYLEKVGIFAASVAIGILIYRYAISKREFLPKLNGLSLSFQQICVSIGAFFAVLVIYIGVF
ncbi:MAG: proton-conducting membrane transporter [Defluviitaleaceae bacterium]|nr:proton-conducting membrane transporter [Defluviitaleaceae bacterium]MCL2215720.1 proton-conducting membrane transporter [Defluviitaleaceae bacterium]